MRKTIATLMTLGVLSGCGGDEKTTAGAGAPTLALTLASTAEGGEIIPIGVTVKDDEDTGLAYDLSCSGGVLTGTLLTTPEVEADTTITCTATATDSKGNTGSAKATVTVKPATVALSSYAGTEDQITAGGFGLLFAENLPLEEEQYQGSLNGRTIPLYRVNGNELMYVLPTDMQAATGDLTVQIGSRVLSVPLTVTSAIQIADPRAAVDGFFQEAKLSINKAIAVTGISSADKEMLQSYLPQLDQAAAQMDSISDADVAQFASFLAANGAITVPQGIGVASYDVIKTSDSCKEAAQKYGKSLASRLVGLGLFSLGAGGIMAGAIPVLGQIAAIEGALIGAVGVVVIWKGDGWNLEERRKTFRETCGTETSIDIFAALDAATSTSRTVSAITLSTKPSFRKDIPRNFRLQRSFDMVSSVRSQANQYLKDIAAALAKISFLPPGTREELEAFKVSGTEVVPASRLSISNISSAKVTGSIASTADPEVFTLRFNTTARKEDLTDGKLPFSVQINRQGEESVIVNAELSLTLPEAMDAAIEVIQSEATSSTVTTVGAETLEVTASPSHGSVVLRDDGSFTYTPSGTYFGPDQFKYRARNEDGVSDEATVLIDIVRKFDGAWSIYSTSKVTFRSSTKICPDEAPTTATVVVSKNSDTQYSASYAGFTINLSMNSKDDPKGLTGNKTVTYDDDPGQTTETIVVSIPDSEHLSGNGTWSYSAPDGSACNGTTSITGTRP